MLRVAEFGIPGLLLFGLWIFAIFDVIATSDGATRNLSKGTWIMIVIFLFDIGALCWLLLGRPAKAPMRVGGGSDSRFGGSTRLPTGVEQINQEVERSKELNRRLENWERENAEKNKAERLGAWEDDLKRREEELRRRDE
jgi:hypothetical protein